MRPLAVLLQGIDVGETSYWSWEWRDDALVGGIHVVPLGQVKAVLSELERALPGVGAEEGGDLEKVRELLGGAPPIQRWLNDRGGTSGLQAGALRGLAALDRCLTGALSRPETESHLMFRLSEVLFHDDFVAQLEDVGADTVVELIVLPSQSCARVPWDLLRLSPDHDLRVLELAMVSTVAPLLSRSEEPFRPRREANLSPLRVIDPTVGLDPSVLEPSRRAAWDERPGCLKFQEIVDRVWLSEVLPDASHFTYVGHVEAGQDGGRPEPALTALVLGESPDDIWGASEANGRRNFSAQDALRGTVGYEGSHSTWPRVPAAARDAAGSVIPRPGRELWPMPARVAIIACESGSDYRDVEPFGLVTAFLELGAQYVTATRWVILTDQAFGLYEEGASPLIEAALRIDDMQNATIHSDPTAALAEWKRERLDDWRRDGKLSDSPITWGAFTLYRAAGQG